MAPTIALVACATPQVTPRELAELRAELRTMRDANARMERRIERLEAAEAVENVARTRPGAEAPQGSGSDVADEEAPEVPELAVVKLKPKREPAPRLDTRVEVVEPDPEILDALAETRARRAAAQSEEPQLAPDVLDAIFESGLSALKTGNVEGGIAKLTTFAEENPRHARADNALYFTAVGQMGLGRYEDAAATLEGLLRRYPAGDAFTNSMLKLAECRQRLNQPKSARELYAKLVAQYPGTPAAEQAEQRLASIGQ